MRTNFFIIFSLTLMLSVSSCSGDTDESIIQNEIGVEGYNGGSQYSGKLEIENNNN